MSVLLLLLQSAAEVLQLPFPSLIWDSYNAATGFWFDAPVSFTLTGAFVAPESFWYYTISNPNYVPQSMAIVKFNPGTNLTYTSNLANPSTNAFTILYKATAVNGVNVIPLNININAGDRIGVLGCRSPFQYQQGCYTSNGGQGVLTTSATSYWPSTLAGSSVNLYPLVGVYNDGLSNAANTPTQVAWGYLVQGYPNIGLIELYTACTDTELPSSRGGAMIRVQDDYRTSGMITFLNGEFAIGQNQVGNDYSYHLRGCSNGGEMVHIYGGGFGCSASRVTSVTVAGIPCASITWQSNYRIVCITGTSPIPQAGPIVVTTTTGTATTQQQFTYFQGIATMAPVGTLAAYTTSSFSITIDHDPESYLIVTPYVQGDPVVFSPPYVVFIKGDSIANTDVYGARTYSQSRTISFIGNRAGTYTISVNMSGPAAPYFTTSQPSWPLTITPRQLVDFNFGAYPTCNTPPCTTTNTLTWNQWTTNKVRLYYMPAAWVSLAFSWSLPSGATDPIDTLVIDPPVQTFYYSDYNATLGYAEKIVRVKALDSGSAVITWQAMTPLGAEVMYQPTGDWVYRFNTNAAGISVPDKMYTVNDSQMNILGGSIELPAYMSFESQVAGVCPSSTVTFPIVAPGNNYVVAWLDVVNTMGCSTDLSIQQQKVDFIDLVNGGIMEAKLGTVCGVTPNVTIPAFRSTGNKLSVRVYNTPSPHCMKWRVYWQPVPVGSTQKLCEEFANCNTCEADHTVDGFNSCMWDTTKRRCRPGMPAGVCRCSDAMTIPNIADIPPSAAPIIAPPMYTCPATTSSSPSLFNLACGKTCTTLTCCPPNPTCASYQCPSVNGLIPKALNLYRRCAGFTCTNTDCCDVAGTCSNYTCGAGTIRSQTGWCQYPKCTDAECCNSPGTCAGVYGSPTNVHCPLNMMIAANASNITCGGSTCTVGECCVPEPSCSNGLACPAQQYQPLPQQLCTWSITSQGSCTPTECCVPNEHCITSFSCPNLPNVSPKWNYSSIVCNGQCTVNDCCNYPPTLAPTTSNPTTSPTTSSPTHSPTTPTFRVPSTMMPTGVPSTLSPTQSPTTTAPTTSPTTHAPTTSPTTRAPTTSPTTHTPTTPTTLMPTTAPSKAPTTLSPSSSPTATKSPTKPKTSSANSIIVSSLQLALLSIGAGLLNSIGKQPLSLLMMVVIGGLVMIPGAHGITVQDTCNYTFYGDLNTSYMHTYIVPAGVSQLEVKLWGAGGLAGSRLNRGPGGGGGYIHLRVNVTSGDNITVYAGQGGLAYPNTTNTTGNVITGGLPGGGYSRSVRANNVSYAGGGGGGYSAIMRNSVLIAVAGGGGGGSPNGGSCGSGGGGGGGWLSGSNGANGCNSGGAGGSGGGQASGYMMFQGQNSDVQLYPAGAGGGGYYGGNAGTPGNGNGNGGGGGGGSSYVVNNGMNTDVLLLAHLPGAMGGNAITAPGGLIDSDYPDRSAVGKLGTTDVNTGYGSYYNTTLTGGHGAVLIRALSCYPGGPTTTTRPLTSQWLWLSQPPPTLIMQVGQPVLIPSISVWTTPIQGNIQLRTYPEDVLVTSVLPNPSPLVIPTLNYNQLRQYYVLVLNGTTTRMMYGNPFLIRSVVCGDGTASCASLGRSNCTFSGACGNCLPGLSGIPQQNTPCCTANCPALGRQWCGPTDMGTCGSCFPGLYELDSTPNSPCAPQQCESQRLGVCGNAALQTCQTPNGACGGCVPGYFSSSKTQRCCPLNCDALGRYPCTNSDSSRCGDCLPGSVADPGYNTQCYAVTH